MSFTDEQPFLDAIFARYHDDGPRLVYADFLDDSGEPERAELVRVQLSLTHLGEHHPRRPELAERQAELITNHSPKWKEHLQHLVADIEFRRGILDSVTVDAGGFLEHGSELFGLARVRRIRLLGVTGHLEKLIDSPMLLNIRELDLCGEDLGNAGLHLLARSPFLGNLDSLDVGFNGLDDNGLAAVARASTLVNLTHLALNDNSQITSRGVGSLANSPFFAGLTSLDLSGNDIDSDGVRVLTSGKLLPRLHTLPLKGNPIGDEGIVYLTQSPLLPRMLARSHRLELRDNSIGPEGAALLAKCPALQRCTTLDLTRNQISERGFAALLSSSNLANVHTLKLGGNLITDAGITAVRALLPKWLDRLRVLELSDNRLTRHGIGALHAARGESGVVLDVSGNVQSAGSDVPVPVGEVMPGVLRGVEEAAELRRRIAHPRSLPNK